MYIDGDTDFHQPEVRPLSGAASASDRAFATGRGPGVVARHRGQPAAGARRWAVVFACRDVGDREGAGCKPLPDNLHVLIVTRCGVWALAAASGRELHDAGPADGFWIHLDADVFDETNMRAVDDPGPVGLAWDEVASALSVAVRSGRAVGPQVAIYNSDIEADGSNGRGLAATLRTALAASPDA
jgi:arginase